MAGILTRRRLFAAGCCCAGALGAATAGIPMLVSTASAADASHGARTDLNAGQALDLLKKGNADFVADRPAPAAVSRERRLEIARGQTPFAVLVGCSDSRVAPELLFGRGLGELFIIRIAGNTVDRAALGSIQYGVAALGCPLVVVLGHERCGAVQAAVQVVKDDKTFPGAIAEMVAPVIPAVLRAQRMQGDLVENAVKENVKQVARRLRESDDILSDEVKAGKVKVVGAYYHLSDGAVNFFDEA